MHCPTLAVTGDRDIQVDPQQVKIMAEKIDGPVEWHIIPEMNHILKQYKGVHTMLGLLKEYKTLLDAPIHPELLTAIASWLRQHSNPVR
jgi:pimeloyl-ACP methyl ester carboxylesterase